MIGYLCKSLRIISLVWPTRLIFITMGEVLSIGFTSAFSQDSIYIKVGEHITVEQLIEKRIVTRISRHDHEYRHHVCVK